MKSAVLALIAVPAFVFVACSQGDVDTNPPGGAGSSSGGSSASTAGTSSSTAGTTSPTAGSSSTAGTMSSGTSGSDSTGGTGTPTAGTGTTAGSGGSASGGTSAGGTSSGGTSTGGTSSGGGGNLTTDVAGLPNALGDSFLNSFFLLPCYKQDAQDCWTTPAANACPNQSGAFEQQGFTQTQTFKLGGTSGSMYSMTFTLNGISEGKYYQGGTRDAGNGAVANADGDAGTDTFYKGGTPVAQEHYNIYKMTVKKPDGSELEHYYLNSFPPNVGRYENHNTFALHYTKTIPVVGGGSIELFIGDSNCHAVDNCGPGEYAGTCTKSRNIPSEPNLVIPTKYMGKTVADMNIISGAKQPYHAQLIHITVTNVTAM